MEARRTKTSSVVAAPGVTYFIEQLLSASTPTTRGRLLRGFSLPRTCLVDAPLGYIRGGQDARRRLQYWCASSAHFTRQELHVLWTPDLLECPESEVSLAMVATDPPVGHVLTDAQLDKQD